MIQIARNKLVVKVAHKYIANFTDIMKTAAIQNNTSVHLEDLVNIMGTVVSLPRSISDDRLHRGFTTKDIEVGDTVMFSFSIIYDWIQKEPEDPALYKNMITYKGQEYWRADITKIFAVIKPDEIKMVNGYVMAMPFDEDKIFMQGTSKKTRGCKSTELMHIGNPKDGDLKLPIKPGCTVYFPPRAAQKYQINNKHFIILPQKHVLGSS